MKANVSKTRFKSLWLVCILIALVLGGCGQATPTPTPARFEAADCMFPVPAGYKIDCGYLFVPEDRSQPNSPLIQLHVAIVRSKSQNPAPDPVVYLQGGPGAHTLDAIAYYVTIFRDVLRDHDLILFDQRGVGYSQPSLNCPEVEEQIYQDLSLNLNPQEMTQHSPQAVQTCHDRLVNEGVNLAAYTNAANAADVNDLRIALGYSEWNLWLPRFIYEFHQGRWGSLPNIFFFNDSLSEGMRLSVWCGVEAYFSSPETVAAASVAVLPRIREALDVEMIFPLCAAWGAKPADPVENEPVISDIPTLILEGDYDPATPPAWGQLAAETLNQAYYF